MAPKQKQLESAAAMLGRRGGLKGGKARAASMTAKRRSAIARLGAEATNAKRRAAKRRRKPRARSAA